MLLRLPEPHVLVIDWLRFRNDSYIFTSIDVGTNKLLKPAIVIRVPQGPGGQKYHCSKSSRASRQ